MVKPRTGPAGYERQEVQLRTVAYSRGSEITRALSLDEQTDAVPGASSSQHPAFNSKLIVADLILSIQLGRLWWCLISDSKLLLGRH